MGSTFSSFSFPSRLALVHYQLVGKWCRIFRLNNFVRHRVFCIGIFCCYLEISSDLLRTSSRIMHRFDQGINIIVSYKNMDDCAHLVATVRYAATFLLIHHNFVTCRFPPSEDIKRTLRKVNYYWQPRPAATHKIIPHNPMFLPQRRSWLNPKSGKQYLNPRVRSRHSIKIHPQRRAKIVFCYIPKF